MIKDRINNHHGMTLVEMIVALVVFSIISTGIASMFIFSVNAFNEHQQMIAEQSSLRLVMNEIDQSLSFANVIGLDTSLMDVKIANQEDTDYTQLYIEGKRFCISQPTKNTERFIPLNTDDFHMEVRYPGTGKIVSVKLVSKRSELEKRIYCSNLVESVGPVDVSADYFTHIAFTLPD